MTILQTRRLLLRRALATDLDDMHAIMADPETMRYWSTKPHTSRQETWAFLSSLLADEDTQGGEFIVERDGSAIGKIGIWRPWEIGFILSRAVWGRGYATEALAAFVAYAFDTVTDHLTAEVDPRNEVSLALLRRAGFGETGRAERTWNIGGVWCGSTYLRLNRPAV